MVRWKRIKRTLRRRAAKSAAKTRTASAKAREESPRVRHCLWQTAVCGALFVSLVALKLVMPEHLSSARGTLGQWLVRDADFTAAFRSVGEAVGGAKDIASSLGEAYTAVFGETEQEAQEVSQSIPIEKPRDLPEFAAAERLELGFSCVSPLMGTVTSPFGWREDPHTGADAFHYGMDIAGESGAAIGAFADGTVSVVGESTELGKYLTVQHAGGFETLYAHCSCITAASGQRVAAGEKIAEVGATGNATGPHLHLELHQDTVFLNPALYLPT